MAKKNGKGKNGRKSAKNGKKAAKYVGTREPSQTGSKTAIDVNSASVSSEGATEPALAEAFSSSGSKSEGGNESRGEAGEAAKACATPCQASEMTHQTSDTAHGESDIRESSAAACEPSEPLETGEPPRTPRQHFPAPTWSEASDGAEPEDATKNTHQEQTMHPPRFDAKALSSVPSPPLAVSTPIQENLPHRKSPSVHSVISETSPLLPGTSRDLESGRTARKSPQNLKIFFLFAIVLGVTLLTYVAFASLRVSDIVEQGFTPKANAISVVAVDDKGFNVQVSTSIASHYSMIRNPILRFSMYVVGAVAGRVFVATADTCDFYVGAKGLDPTHVFSASIPKLPLDLADDTVSEANFMADVVFEERGLVALGDYLENCSSTAPQLDVIVKMDPVIRKNIFKFTKRGEEFTQKVVLNLTDFTSLALQNLSLSLGEDELRIRVSAYATKKVPIEYDLQEMQHELSVPDCNSTLRRLGVFNTSRVHISPDIFPSTQIDMLISEVTPELLQECSDGLSPFNKFMSSLANDNLLCGYVNTKSGQGLPKWLSAILQTPHRVAIAIPPDLSLPVPSFPAEELILEDFDVVILTENDTLSALVGTNVTMAMDVPFQLFRFSAEASQVNYTLQVYDSENMKGAGSSGDILALSDSGGEFSFSADKNKSFLIASASFPNTTAKVQNSTEVGRLLNGFLNGASEIPTWYAQIHQADFSSSLVTARIKNLVFHSRHPVAGFRQTKGLVSKQSSGVESTGRSIVDNALANLDLIVENTIVASTSRSEITLVVDFEVSNSLNISLAISEHTSFDLSYNCTPIGIAELTDLALKNNGKRQKLSTSLSLYYESESQRVLVEEFLSHIISGSNATRIGVKGKKGDTQLSKVLQEVQISGLKVPEITYKESSVAAKSMVPTSGNLHTDETSRGSPFLLGATIHLWSSEIEVTILNPLSNMEINARIQSCIASYNGHVLAHIEHSEVVVVPPGVYQTPRIPIEISQGIGADILRRALNGDLAVDVVAEIQSSIGHFPAEVVYRGSGLTARIKI